MNVLGALLGSHSHAGRHVGESDLLPGFRRGKSHEGQAQETDITQTQQWLSERLSQRLNEKLPATREVTAITPTVTTPAVDGPTAPASEDFSPAAVTDRILGFIEQRLAQYKVDGATDQVLQQRMQQAVAGVRQGMEEAREELEARGMFADQVRDDYFETFGRVQQGLDDLGERLGLAPVDANTPSDPVAQIPTTPAVTGAAAQKDASGQTSVQAPGQTIAPGQTATPAKTNAPGQTIVTDGSTPPGQAVAPGQARGPGSVAATGTQFSTGAAVVSASRNFEMEVTTRDGDVVKINVSSAREFSALMASFSTEDASANGFDASLSGEDNFSFSVEGELDAGEMEALNDLFAQVNDVAETFYGGNVEAAFEQALAVGYDQNELAGFAANMTQTQTIAVTQAYTGVAEAGGGDVGQNSLLSPLVEFARHVRNAENALRSGLDSLLNGNDLFRRLLGQLPSGATEATTSVDTTTATGSPWQQFVDGVMAPAGA